MKPHICFRYEQKVSKQTQKTVFKKVKSNKEKKRGFSFEYDQEAGPKGVKLGFKYDHEAPYWIWHCADQEGTDSYVLFGSNDLCLNRKPPNDLETFLTTLIRIRSKSDQKGLSYDSNTIKKLCQRR